MSITENIKKITNKGSEGIELETVGSLRDVANESGLTQFNVKEINFHPWAVKFADHFSDDIISHYVITASFDKIIRSIRLPITHARYPLVFAYMVFRPTFDAKSGYSSIPCPSAWDCSRFKLAFEASTGLELPEDWWDQVVDTPQPDNDLHVYEDDYEDDYEDSDDLYEDYRSIRSRAAKKAWETRRHNEEMGVCYEAK